MKLFAATVGMFDGVHAGHRHVLGALQLAAAVRCLDTCALTFARHLLTVLDPGRTPAVLTPPDRKLALIEGCGIDRVEFLDFKDIAASSAAAFLTALKKRGCRLFLMGFNNHIGHDRLTAPEAAALGIMEVLQAPPAQQLDGVSSTAIRREIEAGDVAAAAAMLTRPYMVEGSVAHGKALGRTIGFPTANVVPLEPRQVLPQTGVYAVRAIFDGSAHPAMAYIGARPTVDAPGASKSLEVNIFDFNGNLYGKRLDVEFMERLRGERKFDNLQQLRDALTHDSAGARDILSRQ